MPQVEQPATVRERILTIIALAAERTAAEQAQLDVETTRMDRAFYAVSRGFPGAFPGLLFDTNGHLPESEELRGYRAGFILSGVFSFPHVLSTRLVMPPTMIALLKEDYEEAVRRALPNLDEIVAFVCDPENPCNLLAKTVAAPLS